MKSHSVQTEKLVTENQTCGPCTLQIDVGDDYFSTVDANAEHMGPWWQSGNTLASHLCGRGSIPFMAVSGKPGSCLPLVGS